MTETLKRDLTLYHAEAGMEVRIKVVDRVSFYVLNIEVFDGRITAPAINAPIDLMDDDELDRLIAELVGNIAAIDLEELRRDL